MASTTLGLSPELNSYVVAHSSAADEVLLDLAAETATLGGASVMQVAPEQGVFLEILTRLVGARRAVEVGTFTGYSSICIARGLGHGGQLICCDVSEEWTGVARRYWERAGLADRIDLRIAPAIETLRALPAEPWIDLVFIDADKGGYLAYWEELVPRVRPGGVLLVDNVLQSGRVLEPAGDANATAVHAFNDRVLADERVDVVMLPLADGVTMARRR